MPALAKTGPDEVMTERRAIRLYRLIVAVSDKPCTRAYLLRHCKAQMRTFYRDLEILDQSGIEIKLSKLGYRLTGTLEDALDRLQFPSSTLTFGDVLRGQCDKKLTGQFQKLRVGAL